MKTVAIVGAGIGGLYTGVSLLLRGYDVTIYEKNETPGGVLRSISSPDGRFRFEESASIPINPNTYHSALKKLDLHPGDYFHDEKLKTLYQVYFHTGAQLRVPYCVASMKRELKQQFPEEVKGWEAFLWTTMKKYRRSKRYFIRASFQSLSSVLQPQTLLELARVNPFTSSSRYVKKFLTSRNLRNFILFQAFFMGVSPHKLPNIYTSVYANSQIEGISHIKGGLSHFARLLAEIFTNRGGKLSCNCPVQQILTDGSSVTGIRVGGRKIPADVVVVNGDYCYAQSVLLSRKSARRFSPSCSVFVLHLGLTTSFPQLNVHNLLINKDFEKEISQVFQGKLPTYPSLYLYYPSVLDDSYCKNPSESVMNLMVRVPNLKDLPISWDEATWKKLADQCIHAVGAIKGLEDIRDYIAYQEVTTPVDFKNRYHCRFGCCFGIGHTLTQSMALRPQLRDNTYSNLFYVGSSIHPGNGASIVLEGGMMVSDAICNCDPDF